ncbi:MAG: hypothetical protein JJ879_05245 [Sneathiella sp.]|nr:hypothetical protein [Sneathiella sp.]
MQNATVYQKGRTNVQEEAARKLIQAVGLKAAVRYCRSQQLIGLENSIKRLSGTG